jgi:YidC/Oxa1 family membrane protein insertase
MMEKRVFLAIFLSFAVLAVYQAYFAPAPPTPATADVSQTPSVTPATPPSPAPTSAAPTSPAPTPQAPASAPLVADAAARDVVVDTDFIHAVFTTAGGTLKSWRLKKYSTDGQPLELVPTDIPAAYPRPFTIATDDPALSQTMATALYRPSSDGLSLGSTAGTLTFEYRDASGLSARKTFRFMAQPRPYLLGVDASVDVNGVSRPVTIEFGPALGLGYKPDGSRETAIRAIQFQNNKVERIAANKLADKGRQEGNFRYAGVDEQYFLVVALPVLGETVSNGGAVQVDYEAVTLPVPNDAKARTRSFVAYSVRAPGPASMPFFLGPKDFNVLQTVDPQLVHAIDFGIFAWLVVPLLQALKWINGYLGNYGWSIIVLTVFINLLIFPLRHRSMVSMRKMQALQPEIKAIQERYAKYKVTDPERQKMNSEMMALYKQKGVNPASGCVPMLLTMPVLFAFYSMLYAAIELRGAPFMFWIHDLSLHDPYYITPLLMGGSQLIQQRMMPSTADPMQQKMFMFMPIMFTFMFLWAPAGLVIYWLMSNLMAIGQQYLTNRIIGAPVRPVPVPRRQGKGKGNAGGGRS